MATFNYTVDTGPMAEEIGNVSKHVNGTTGAVVAMRTAVIIAEEKASDLICDNVNRGFYSLIRSQISQKVAKLQSEVDSHLMQLVQQKNALLNIKNRMQRDYNMISGRYIKLFNGLNANLKSRIFALDKPTINFACNEIDKISNRSKYLTATIPISQIESISVSQKIIASNIKHKGMYVLNSMKLFIHDMNLQKLLNEQILIEDKDLKSIGNVFIPIAIIENNRGPSNQYNVEVIVTNNELNNNVRSEIINKLYSDFNKLNWAPGKTASSEVSMEYNKLVIASTKSVRIKELTLKYFQTNNYQTF
ncbi:MAG: hypothetical protein KBD42_03345 [Chitinophagales bacterium]|jgi:hypothetical protein|nr:hypothetical protein [Chitinophagales bacterium]